MRKLTIVVALGVGYVLGAKAGRTRYEQIRSAARQAPAVKEKVVAAAEKIRPHSDDRAADAAWQEDPAAHFSPMTG